MPEPTHGGGRPPCVFEQNVENLSAVLQDVAESMAKGLVLEDFSVVSLLAALSDDETNADGIPLPQALLRLLYKRGLIRPDQYHELLTHAAYPSCQ